MTSIDLSDELLDTLKQIKEMYQFDSIEDVIINLVNANIHLMNGDIYAMFRTLGVEDRDTLNLILEMAEDYYDNQDQYELAMTEENGFHPSYGGFENNRWKKN